MRKIINSPQEFVTDVLKGIVTAHPDFYRFVSPDGRAVAGPPTPGRVGIVSGGGSGHLPLFLGYVGTGLIGAAAIGNVFSSPSPAQILAATKAADSGSGVLYLYGNYGGDVYNFDIAADLAGLEGIDTRTVLGRDDVLSAPADDRDTRRGVAGLIIVYKIAGAAAQRGDDLATVASIAQRAAESTRTAGVGLAPTILPAAGRPTFELADGEMEVGIGIHGESGVSTSPIAPARAIAATLINSITDDLPLAAGNRVAVLINGLGATPLEELYILYSDVADLLADRDVHIAYNFIGEYATSLEMAGASVSVTLLDDELENLLNSPASSPFYRPGTSIPQPRAIDPQPRPNEVGDADFEIADFESALRRALLDLKPDMAAHIDELRDLDAAIGDGDLGVTVAAGLAAVDARIRQLPTNITSSALMREAALAFASANPSTFAALISGGMLAGAAEIDDGRPIELTDALAVGRAASLAITRRGGAELGDKTLLDVLVPALDELERGASPAEFTSRLDRLIEETARLRSRRGRAAWHQERSIGKRDPGSVAVAYALRSIVSSSRHAG